MTRTFIQTNEFVKKWEELGLTDYGKNEKENLTKEECNNIKKVITILEAELEGAR